jgi:peptidoglycan hydrolase CwlO-like protein
MSKKVLILGIVLLLAVGGVGAYVWVSYSQAQDSLNHAWQAVRALGENMDRKDVNLHELYRMADAQVDQLERFPSSWIDKAEVAKLRTTLQDEKKELDERAAAAAKKNPPPDYGGWIHPAPQ